TGYKGKDHPEDVQVHLSNKSRKKILVGDESKICH
ncbi:hypothetical protein LEP1GSC074_1295, partial [Leptospira noguchii str. Hook]